MTLRNIFLKENPIDQSKTICSICGFLLNVDSEGWFDFVLKCKHLFLRNIYTFDDFKKMEIETKEKYSDTIYRLLEDYPLFEKALMMVIFVMKLEIFWLKIWMLVVQH